MIYGAYTGKAALVMRKNGCADATTIHSFLYSHQTDDRGHVTWTVNKDGPAARAKLIVIDEVSMVNRQMGEDLLSLGVPILVLGDPAQLPPVDRGKDAGGFFTAGPPRHHVDRDPPAGRRQPDHPAGDSGSRGQTPDVRKLRRIICHTPR